MKMLTDPFSVQTCDDPDCDCGYAKRQVGTPQDEAILKIYEEQEQKKRAAYQKKGLYCSLFIMVLSIPALLGA